MATAWDDMEDVKQELCTSVMSAKWDKVVDIYKEHPEQEVQGAAITLSGDTALHMAVYTNEVKIVEKLMGAVSEGADLVDDRRNGPLHHAAKMGKEKMCECIARKKPGLIGDRNNDGETPLFLAALHGKKEAFITLCIICIWKECLEKIYQYGRRNSDGRTVLHCAIDGEYFDLAFQIIGRFPDFLKSVDQRGYTILHLLACKHSAFQSSTRLTWLQNFIYRCTPAEKPRMMKDDDSRTKTLFNESQKTAAPEEGTVKEVSSENPTSKPQMELKVQAGDDNNNNNNVYKKTPLASKKEASDSEIGSTDDRVDDDGQLQHSPSHRVDRPSPKSFRRPFSERKDSSVTNLENPVVLNAPPRKSYLSRRCIYTARKLIKRFLMVTDVLQQTGVRWKKIFFPKHKVEMKEKHLWSIVIMKILVRSSAFYDYRANGSLPTSHLSISHPFKPNDITDQITQLDNSHAYQKSKDSQVFMEISLGHRSTTIETPILIAAKNGISELVNGILKVFPVAIHDVNPEGKNLMLLAVENRQPHVYKMLLDNKNFTYNLLNCVDNERNNALHHAAMLKTHQPWIAPDAVLQMQWEIKWYEFIRDSVPNHLSAYRNNQGKTPDEIFMETHSDLVKNDREWLVKTSESCTLVATLIATVAFATSSSVPGGINAKNGQPVLKQEGMFKLFAISSLLALCFSLTAAIMFLAILTSRHQPTDFKNDLPRKLLVGLTALFISIASVLTSFCGAHFFVLRGVLNDAGTKCAEYLVVLLPVAFFAAAQFPLYFKLILATIFKKVPERGFMLTASSSEGSGGPTDAVTTPAPPRYWRVINANNEDVRSQIPDGAMLVYPAPQNEILALMKSPSSNSLEATT